MSKLLFLNREALLSRVTPLRVEKVELSNGFVYVKEMTGHEKDIWEQSMMKTLPNGNPNATPQVTYELKEFRAKLAVVSICDNLGNLLFGIEDATLLNNTLGAADLEKIVAKAQQLNGMTEPEKTATLKN